MIEYSNKFMSTTIENKGEQNEVINEVELEACRLRFEGYTSKEISQSLGLMFGFDHAPTSGLIRQWFMRGGKLDDYYRAYANEEAKIRKQEARDVFKAHLTGATRTLVFLMGKSESDMVRYLASKEIVNRELGEPVKPVANLNVNNPAREILQEAGLIDKPNDTGEVKQDS